MASIQFRILGVGLAFWLAACGSVALAPDGGGSDGGAGTGSAAGTTGAAGTNGGAGTTGAAGTTGGAGTGATIALKVVVPADRPYCDQTLACTAPAHLQILTAAGQPIIFSMPFCSTMCSNMCQAVACPLLCVAPHGTMFTGAQIDWDGSYYTMSTCGMNVQCYQKHQSASGHFIARMCGTPGKLDNPDAGFQANCVASGPQVCVDVPFDYPGPTPVIGRLP